MCLNKVGDVNWELLPWALWLLGNTNPRIPSVWETELPEEREKTKLPGILKTKQNKSWHNWFIGPNHFWINIYLFLFYVHAYHIARSNYTYNQTPKNIWRLSSFKNSRKASIISHAVFKNRQWFPSVLLWCLSPRAFLACIQRQNKYAPAFSFICCTSMEPHSLYLRLL